MRLGLHHFLLLQVLVAPLFLGPLYERFENSEDGTFHPLVVLASIVVAPALYAAIFSSRTAIRVINRESRDRRSVVFPVLITGCLSGIIYGTLVFASLWINWNWLGERQRFEAAGIYRSVRIGELTIVGLICYAYLMIIGLATGGIVGVLADWWRDRRSRTIRIGD